MDENTYPFQVGSNRPGEQPARIAAFVDHDTAAKFIGSVLGESDPDGVAAGHYYLDGPTG